MENAMALLRLKTDAGDGLNSVACSGWVLQRSLLLRGFLQNCLWVDDVGPCRGQISKSFINLRDSLSSV